MAYTLHYHEHDKDKWTAATLINDRTLNDKKVWGYGMEFEPDPTVGGTEWAHWPVGNGSQRSRTTFWRMH